jgi:hypothetical protein
MGKDLNNRIGQFRRIVEDLPLIGGRDGWRAIAPHATDYASVAV